MNLRSIRLLWRQETSNDGRRWQHVLGSILLYTCALARRLARVQLHCASIGFGTVASVPGWARGWGKTLFHIALEAFAHALADSARKA